MWVEQLKNGKFRCAERYTDPLTGKSKKVSVVVEKNNAGSRKAANAILQERIREAVKDPVTETTLQELADLYLLHQEKSVKASTWRRNKFAVESIVKILGADTIVDRMTAGYVREKFLETGRAPGTLNEKLSRLKALLRWGYQNDRTGHDITGKLKNFHDVPHKEKIAEKFMSGDELHALLDGMSVKEWKLLTQFLVLSGLRFGEAAALEKTDVDLKSQMIHVTKTFDSVNRIVTTPKSITSIRDVYTQPELLDACRKINAFMAERRLMYGKESSFFLHDRLGKHIDYYAFNKYLRENTEKIIGRPLTVHALRHTHASLMFEAGVSLDAISRRLGHEDSDITREIYIHVTKKLLEQDNQQIGKVSML